MTLALYTAGCVYVTYLVGSAPGEDITAWRLSLYGAALVSSFAVGAVAAWGGSWFVPLVVALAWSAANSLAAEPFFDPWYLLPVAGFAAAEAVCVGFGNLMRRGVLRGVFVREEPRDDRG